MNRISKLLSLAVLFSYGLATENTEETIVEKTAVVEESQSDNVATDQETAPVDIEKMMRARKAKAEKEKMDAMRLLHQHKNPVPQSDANMDAYSDRKQAEERIKKNKRNGLFKTLAESLRKKFPTRRLRSTDGKRAIKFPTNTQTN
jgi:Skp family chaperone for outer membrane proteins